MKNLKKALAAVIALSVMSWSCAAFADVSATGEFSGGNGAVSADYTEIGDNKVTATVDTSLAMLGTEMTFLILDDGTNVASINEADILYIDQKTLTAGDDSFTGVINLARIDGGTGAEALPEGSYPIRVGYYYDNAGEKTFGLAAATMVVSYGSSGVTVSFILGDVNGADSCNLADANYIVAKIGGATPSVGGVYAIGQTVTDVNGKAFTFGDVNGADGCNLADANYIVAKIGGATPTVGATDGEGNAVAIGGTMSFVVPE